MHSATRSVAGWRTPQGSRGVASALGGRFVRKSRSLALVLFLGSAWFAACGSDDGAAGVGDGDAGAEGDGSGGGRDATNGVDSAGGDRDATPATDTGTEDVTTGDDGASNDAATIDTGSDADDGATTDASDANLGSDALDAGAADAKDAIADVTDASDAADVVDAGPPDANASCVVAVFGDYYVRNNGTAVNGTNDTVVLDDATGQPLTGITQIVQEPYSACALTSGHAVYCWPTFDPAPGFGGNNEVGQLGNGTFTEITDSSKFYRGKRVLVANPDGGAGLQLDNVTSLSSGSNYPYVFPMCAVRSDKTLWCWGPTTQGSVFQGTTGSASTNLAYATRIHMDSDAASEIDNVDQVSSGGRHICYLSAGKVYCFGANIAGNLGTGDTNGHIYPVEVTLPAAASQVAAGGDITCAVVGTGVYCWGTQGIAGNPVAPKQLCNLNYCQPLPVQVLSELTDGGGGTPLDGITDLVFGYQFACARDKQKSLHCWGNSEHGAVLAARAFTNFNSASGVPSSPIASYTANGIEGYDTRLRYLTTSGVLVYGSSKKTPICP